MKRYVIKNIETGEYFRAKKGGIYVKSIYEASLYLQTIPMIILIKPNEKLIEIEIKEKE